MRFLCLRKGFQSWRLPVPKCYCMLINWCLTDSKTPISAQLAPYKSVPIFDLYMEWIVKNDLYLVMDGDGWVSY